MKGKTLTLFYCYAYYLGVDPSALIRLYSLIDDPISILDRRRLSEFGIPTRDMNSRKDVKDYIMRIGYEYVKIRRKSEFRAFHICLQRLKKEIKKELKKSGL